MTTTEKKTTTMTPAQFTAAKALADAYYHLWASVPNGTYNLEDIEAYGQSIDSQFAGITSPGYMYIDPDNTLVVTHQTATGRTSWEIQPTGNTRIQIHRPGYLYEGFGEVNGVVVLQVDVINDSPTLFDITDDSTADIIIQTSQDISQDIPLSDLLTKSILYDNCGYSTEYYDKYACQRHVSALIRPLVALIEASFQANYPKEYPGAEPDEGSSQQEWDTYNAMRRAHSDEHYAEVIKPAIEHVKAILAPLFANALPDPIDPIELLDSADHSVLEAKLKELPETFWSSPRISWQDTPRRVFHKGEKFLVESERVAVYMVLKLRQEPNLTLIEAYNEAMCTSSYRP
jgi:hypothetical protein